MSERRGDLPAAPEEYLRGYVDALLDSRYPGLGLRARAVTPDGGVAPTARTCLDPSQKRDIEYLPVKGGHVKTLRRDLATDCDKPSTASQPPRLEQEEKAPIPIDVRAPPETERFARRWPIHGNPGSP